MPFGILAWLRPLPVAHAPEVPPVNRPHRGKRAKVKAAREANRRRK